MMESFFHLEQPRQLAQPWSMVLARQAKIARAKLEQMKLWQAGQLLGPRPLNLNLKFAPRERQQLRQWLWLE
jgi:hypothetical protein